jgi:hypothetical protein
MRPLRPLVLISLVAFLLVPARALAAKSGCRGASGSAAIEQYCETLSTAAGGVDVTQKAARPLAQTLPKRVVARLQRSGKLGQLLLALPSGDTANGATAKAARRAASDPKLNQFLLKPAPTTGSVVRAGLRGPDGRDGGPLAWAMLIVLFFLGGGSLGRWFGKLSAR